VLSCSLGTDVEMWAPQLDALAGRFQLLRYDSRGHGGSDAPEGPYSIERLGLDVLELLDAYALPRAHFCGLSMGGMVGQWLGANAAMRIDRLVVANTAPSIGTPESWQERIDRVLGEGMEAIADGVIERWFTADFQARAPDTVARMRAMLVATPPVGYAGCCAAIRDLDLSESNGRITRPMLIIAGSADPTTPPERSRAIALAMKTVPEVVTLQSAHLSNVEQPEAFTRAVAEFLS
jgi:3-oxoadipate enol-lactonase